MPILSFIIELRYSHLSLLTVIFGYHLGLSIDVIYLVIYFFPDSGSHFGSYFAFTIRNSCNRLRLVEMRSYLSAYLCYGTGFPK